MPERAVYHVAPTDHDWSLHREGDSYDWRYYATKQQAIQEGQREASTHSPGQLIIHNDDGRVEEAREFTERTGEMAR